VGEEKETGPGGDAKEEEQKRGGDAEERDDTHEPHGHYDLPLRLQLYQYQ
jgi:hypothetical protein